MFLKKRLQQWSGRLAALAVGVYKYNHFLPTKKQFHKKHQPTF
jgi:hypothetical protein